MTLREVYDEVLLDIYNNAVESIKLVGESGLKKELVVNYIKSSKMYYGLKFEVLCNSYIILFDDFITLDDFKELSKYADKLSYYLKECLE
jgi:hypothetical protein